jgi:hypothetical protein
MRQVLITALEILAMGHSRDIMQADHTLSRMFPRYLLCPYCPPTHQHTPKAWGIEVQGEFDETWDGKNEQTWSVYHPWYIEIKHHCDICEHGFNLIYSYDPDSDVFEFSMQPGHCPPACTEVHGLRGGG